MKKAGYFFLTFLPLIIAFGIQFLMMFFLMGTSALYAVYTQDQPMSYLTEVWMDMNFNTLVMILFSLGTILFFGLWYYSRCNGDLVPRPKQHFHPLMLVGILLLMPGLQYLTSVFISVISAIFPSWLEAYEKLMESAGLDENISLLMLCYSVLLAPIGEELIFRGVTLRTARCVFPFWAANIFQAVLFGVFHMNMLQGCYAFLLALFLGYICERGGSIYYSILLHFLFNLFGTVISEYIEIGDSVVDMAFFLFIAFVLPIAGMLLFRLGIKFKQKKVQNLEKKPIIEI